MERFLNNGMQKLNFSYVAWYEMPDPYCGLVLHFAIFWFCFEVAVLV
jgi:hypothetical protein